MKGDGAQGAPARRRQGARRLRRRGRRRHHAVRALRGQARARQRQPRAAPPSSSPRTGAPIACCAGSRRCWSSPTRTRTLLPVGHRRRDRARRRRGRDRLGRHLRARRGARAARATRRSPRARSPRARCGIAAEICIYTNATADDRGAVVASPPSDASDLTPRRDRRRARSLHRRPARGQARGRGRAAQSLAAPAASPASSRDEIAPKNIIMIGPTGVGKTEIARRLAKLAARAVRQGRGDEVHRGRLRRPRRRVDRARSRRGRRQARARGGARAVRAARAATPPRSACSISCCRAPRRSRQLTDAPRRAERRPAASTPTREKLRASCCATASSTTARSRSRSPTTRPIRSLRRSFSRQGMDEMGARTCKDMLPAASGRKTKRRKLKVPEARDAPHRGGGRRS